MLQFTKDKSKKVKALQETLDKEFVERFSQLVTEVYKQPNSVIMSQGKNDELYFNFLYVNKLTYFWCIDVFAYIAGQCFSNLPAKAIKELDHKVCSGKQQLG